MKTIKTSLLLIAVLTTALFAQQAPKTQEAGPKVQPRLSVKKDQILYYSVKASAEIDSEQFQMETITTKTYSAKVIELTKGGGAKFLVTCTAVKGSIDSPMFGQIEFDSASEEQSDDPMAGMLTQSMSDMVGKVATVTVDARGRATKTETKESDKPASGGMGGGMGLSMAGGADASVIFSGVLDKMPKGGVVVGSSWKTDSMVGAAEGSPMSFSQKGTVSLVSGNAEKLVYKSKTKPQLAGEIGDGDEESPVSNVEIQGGTFEVTSTVSAKTGLQTSMKQTVDMDMFMEGPMGEMEMTVINKTEVKVIAKPALEKKGEGDTPKKKL